ncbi:hypothetical protein AXW83_18990 [Bosea sp. PAMC 26642]|nr:hypothetical protein AXW83_18990 [Bosea sp. PAMC 26642]
MALLLGLSLIAGCGHDYGQIITELPADRGWQPLPIGDWVLNDGIAAKAMVFCPRETCLRQGFAALITLEGGEADALEGLLRKDPASLARSFAKPPPIDETRKKAKAKPSPPKSRTTVSRFSDDGVAGVLVEIRARDANGKRAATAILSAREAGALVVALAVSPDPDAARRDVGATWRSR